MRRTDISFTLRSAFTPDLHNVAHEATHKLGVSPSAGKLADLTHQTNKTADTSSTDKSAINEVQLEFLELALKPQQIPLGVSVALCRH